MLWLRLDRGCSAPCQSSSDRSGKRSSTVVAKSAKQILTGAALCDSGAYSGSVVEARELAARRESDRHTREFLL